MQNCGTIALLRGTAGQYTNLSNSPAECWTVGKYADPAHTHDNIIYMFAHQSQAVFYFYFYIAVAVRYTCLLLSTVTDVHCT